MTQPSSLRMKLFWLIAVSSAAAALAPCQTLLPYDRPRAEYPLITEAFEGKTTVRRTVDSAGLVHYMVRFFHGDVVGHNRGWYLSDVVLSVTDANGEVISQAWLDVSGLTTEAPDNTKFRMIRFSIHEEFETGGVLSIGLHQGMRVHFSPYRLAPEKPKAEQDGADQPATAPESKAKGEENPEPESEVRPQ